MVERMMWLSWNFDDTFSLFETIPECSRQTDKRNDKRTELPLRISHIALHEWINIMRTHDELNTKMTNVFTIVCKTTAMYLCTKLLNCLNESVYTDVVRWKRVIFYKNLVSIWRRTIEWNLTYKRTYTSRVTENVPLCHKLHTYEPTVMFVLLVDDALSQVISDTQTTDSVHLYVIHLTFILTSPKTLVTRSGLFDII